MRLQQKNRKVAVSPAYNHLTKVVCEHGNIISLTFTRLCTAQKTLTTLVLFTE